MIPTFSLRERLRKLINDPLPPTGSEKQPIFSDEELDDVLSESETIYQAASVLWSMRAALIQSQIESYSIGDEKYEYTSMKDQYTYALKMAETYAAMPSSGKKKSGLFLKVKRPGVL